MGLLDAGGFQVVEDHPGEVLLFAVPEAGFGDVVDELVVLIDTEQAVRRQALHGEGAGDADFLVVLIGLVVEVFVVRLGGDGGVDLLLPGDALPINWRNVLLAVLEFMFVLRASRDGTSL